MSDSKLRPYKGLKLLIADYRVILTTARTPVSQKFFITDKRVILATARTRECLQMPISLNLKNI